MNRHLHWRAPCLIPFLFAVFIVLAVASPTSSQAALLADPVARTSDPMIEAETAAAIAESPSQWIGPTRMKVGYDRGFFIDSTDNDAFRLKINLQNQFRYTGLGRTQSECVDATGAINRTPNRNDFEINRGRLIFFGHAVDPDLNYYINLDYGSLGDDRVTVLLAWLNYRFNRGFDLYLGKGKVPGGREWLLTSMYTMSPDRSMATTFFRPSITTGVWAKGEPLERMYYQALVGNGFNTTSAGIRGLDTNFVYSANTWWELLGEFGGLYSDLSFHEDLA